MVHQCILVDLIDGNDGPSRALTVEITICLTCSVTSDIYVPLMAHLTILMSLCSGDPHQYQTINSHISRTIFCTADRIPQVRRRTRGRSSRSIRRDQSLYQRMTTSLQVPPDQPERPASINIKRLRPAATPPPGPGRGRRSGRGAPARTQLSPRSAARAARSARLSASTRSW